MRSRTPGVFVRFWAGLVASVGRRNTSPRASNTAVPPTRLMAWIQSLGFTGRGAAFQPSLLVVTATGRTALVARSSACRCPPCTKTTVRPSVLGCCTSKSFRSVNGSTALVAGSTE